MRQRLVAAGFAVCFVGSAAAQLRVATWNVSNYNGGRVADIQNAVFASFNGRSMNPDVILGQEFLSQTAVNAFLSALNTAPGSSGTWSAATFVNGNDTDNAFFYRSDRVLLVNSTVVSVGGASPLPPRNTNRYDIRLKGYLGVGPRLALYSSHMNSGSDSIDETRRLNEATAIRNDAQALGAGYQGFAVGGDFNVPSSSDPGYAKLVQSEANNHGRSFDPIASPGSWNNNSSFRYIHTQDPIGSGGMDSRFDFVLLSGSLVDGIGFDYIGNPAIPYSTTTWNDLNHSYRAWGNDGSTFNGTLAVGSNSMVGPTIAQALINAATTAGGHLPVFLDLRVPAEISAAPGSINFGNVVQGTAAAQPFDVANGVDIVLWRTGIANLTYSLSVGGGFSVPGGSFVDAAGGGVNTHNVTLDTSTLGAKNGFVSVSSTDPNVAPASIPVSANVIPDAIAPATMSVSVGQVSSGNVAQLLASDNQRVEWQNANWGIGGRFSPVFQTIFEATSSLQTPSSMTFEMEAYAAGTFQQEIELWDFKAGTYVLADVRSSTPGDSIATLALSNPARFVEPGTRKLRARVTITPTAWSLPRIVSGGIDRLVWKPR